MVIVANKMDDEGAILLLEDFKERVGDKYKIFPISALTREGLQPLLYHLAELLKVTPEFPLFGDDEKVKVYKYISSADDEKGYKITRPSEDVFVISGARIEKIYHMTNISTDEGLMYLTSIIRKMGIEDELRQMGIEEGDTVRLCDFEFTYYD
jgi:GTP-binding protein